MAFPIAPSVNDVYVNGGVQYKWNGYAWDVVNTIGTASMFTYEYIATAGQTVFNVGYYAASKYVDVWLNGVKLSAGEYAADTGSTVVLTTGATVGDIVCVKVYDAITMADTIKSVSANTLSSNSAATVSYVDGALTFGIPSGPQGIQGEVGPQGPAGEVSIAQLTTALSTKQDALVSGTNIKTVNGTSVLGSGNIATGDVTLNGIQTLTNKTITGLKETAVAMPANDVDLNLGNLFTKTISGATTLTVSNAPTSGTVGYFILQLTNGGSATVTWFSGVKWAGGTAPTLTASGKDILSFYTIDAGTTWNCVSIQKDAK